MKRWLVTMLGVLAVLTMSSSAFAKVFQYKARLAEPVEEAGPVRAGIFNWTCRENACSINGPWKEPGVGHCKALARKVGKITAYGHADDKLTDEQLAECNSVVSDADAP